MLYVSRVAGVNIYGVIDTDDGVEDVVSLMELHEAVSVYDLEIEGVTTTLMPSKGSNSELVKVIQRVTVYQNNVDMSVNQTKALVMHGIDVRVRDGKIRYITWDNSVLKEGTRLRLSDFGTSCDNYVFIHSEEAQHEVIIVLDDKVRVGTDTFKSVFRRGKIVIDMREVTDMDTVKSVYMEVIAGSGVVKPFYKCVVDGNERLKFWSVMDRVYRGIDGDEPSEEISAQVGDWLYKDFEPLGRQTIEIHHYGPDVKAYVQSICDDEAFWRSRCQDYDEVYKHDKDAIGTLRMFANVMWDLIFRFGNYMKFCKPTERMKSLYVKVCNNANNVLLDVGEMKGWI